MTKSCSTDNTKCWQGCRVIETLIHCYWEYEMFQSHWRNIWQFHKYKRYIKDLTIPLLIIYPRKLKIYIHTNICTKIFTAALIIIAKSERNPDNYQWINRQNVVYSHNKILFSHKKWSTDMSHKLKEPWKHDNNNKWKKPGKNRLHQFSSVQFSRSVMSDSLWPHELQNARPPSPSPTSGVHSNSRPSSWWCHPAISSSVVPFSSCLQSLPASESFPMSQLFTLSGQSTGV